MTKKRASRARVHRRQFSRLSSRLSFESLEYRRMLASTASFSSGLLTVTGDGAANSLTVTYAASGGSNYVVVKDGAATIYDGVAQNKLTSAVTSISLDAGAGNDTVTLTDVTTANGFTGLTGTAVTLQGNTGADTITGSSFNDSILGGDGADSLVGGDGNDSLVGNQSNDTISGGNGNDSLQGATGNDSLTGGAGNDSYQYSRATTTDNLGSDTITEGTGGSNDSQDGVDFTVFLESVTINLTSTTVVSHADVTVTVNDSSALEAATGSSLADTITGNSRAGLLVGGAGNDTITGGSSSDSIYGGSGDDSIVGGSGEDYIDGYTGNDTVKGDAGDDHYTFIRTGSENLGTDTFTETSANGTDGFDFTSINTAVALDLSSSSSQTVSSSVLTLTLVNPTNFEWALGGTGNDTLTGNSAAVNLLCGGAGDDTLTGGAGGDHYVMLGSDLGTERINESSTDPLEIDGIYFSLFEHAVTVDLSSTANQTVATGFLEVVISDGSALENVIGSVYADSLTGNSLLNDLEGGAGNDTLVGGGGDDIYVFSGSALGSDTITEANDLDSDLLDFSLFSSSVSIDLSTTSTQTISSGNLQLTLSGGTAIEEVWGGGSNDSLVGNSRNNFLRGGGGNDTLAGGAGDDVYVFLGAALGSDLITEGANADADTISLSAFGSAVTLDLSSTSAQTVSSGNLQLTLSSATGIEGIEGSGYADSLTGNSRNNTLSGGAGNDSLAGGSGSDLYLFYGTGLGSDTVTEASDTEADELGFEFFGGAVSLDISSTSMQTVNSGNLQLTLSSASGIERVTGSEYNDSITGNSRANILVGSGGNDTLGGANGRDFLIGDIFQSEGTDSLDGGGDDDIILSGRFDPGATDYRTAVAVIMEEWESVGHTYAERVDNILGVGANPIDSAYQIIERDTAFDDGVGVDTLVGGSGNDWFLDDDGEDSVSDLTGSEVETDIG